MSGTSMVSLDVKEQVHLLRQSPVLLEASNALASIPETVTITSDEEDAALGDLALKAKKGVRHIETGLTDLFRPMKTFEKLMREHFKANMLTPLEAAVARVDAASRTYRLEKQRAAAEAQRAAEEAAREAARVAAEEAEARRAAEEAAALAGEPVPQSVACDLDVEDEFDVAPGVAQVVAAPVATVVRGESATTFERRTLRCTLENATEARATWTDAFVFDERAAVELFKLDNPQPQGDLDAGIVIGGVRFYNDVSIQRRAR